MFCFSFCLSFPHPWKEFPLFWSVSLSVGNQGAPESFWKRDYRANDNNKWQFYSQLNEEMLTRSVHELFNYLKKTIFYWLNYSSLSWWIWHMTSNTLFSVITKQHVSHVMAFALTLTPDWQRPHSAHLTYCFLPDRRSVHQPDRCAHTQPSSYWELREGSVQAGMHSSELTWEDRLL